MKKFKILFEKKDLSDIRKITKSGNKSDISKLERIMDELELHPETGIGKPEQLKYELTGYWSREINKKDRIIYQINNQLITVSVVSALGHYIDR